MDTPRITERGKYLSKSDEGIYIDLQESTVYVHETEKVSQKDSKISSENRVEKAIIEKNET